MKTLKTWVSKESSPGWSTIVGYSKTNKANDVTMVTGGSKVSPESSDWIEIAATCLSLEGDDLRHSLTSRLMQTKNMKKGTTYM